MHYCVDTWPYPTYQRNIETVDYGLKSNSRE